MQIGFTSLSSMVLIKVKTMLETCQRQIQKKLAKHFVSSIFYIRHYFSIRSSNLRQSQRCHKFVSALKACITDRYGVFQFTWTL